MNSATRLFIRLILLFVCALWWDVSYAQCPGCCSSHGGITQSCSANGRVRCADGTTSPSCTCASCGVGLPLTFSLSVGRDGNGLGLITSTPAGISCGSVCRASFSSGSYVTLRATANAGSAFSGWTGACTGTGSCGVLMTGTRSVTSRFNLSAPTLLTLDVLRVGLGEGTVVSSASGINCGAICSAGFTSSTSVTLTANPSAGSVFDGWSGACSGTGACILTMSQARLIIANFSLVGSATSFQPESGLWWNASESGRGFNIEVQDSLLLFSGYLYDRTGAAQWYVAQGPYSHTGHEFRGSLLAFRGGQCMGCSYSAPSSLPSPGELILRFSTASSGTLFWPGGAVSISRAIYGSRVDVGRLLGTWSLSTSTSAGQVGDWFEFHTYEVVASEARVRGRNLAGRDVVAAVAGGLLILLSDFSPTHYDMYVFDLQRAGSVNLGSGHHWRYLKVSSASGLGSSARALKFEPARPAASVSEKIAPTPSDLESDLREVIHALDSDF
jgi:hypothetical protein